MFVKASFRSGNILPFSLVMTAAILLGGMTLSLVVISGLKRTAQLDRSMVAYYAADAGIEKQLYEVRKNDIDIADLVSMNDTFANGSEWESTDGTRFLNTNVKTFAELNEEDFQFVDLFDPDSANAAAGVGKVVWTWSDDGSPGCQVELGYAEWDTTGPSIIPQEFKIVFGTGGSAFQNLNPDRAYRLRFRPRKCDVTNLQVTAYPTSGSVTPMLFPGDITIASQGTYRSTSQSIAVTMPRLDILSGVFNYVIFSECTLFKNPDGSTPPCS